MTVLLVLLLGVAAALTVAGVVLAFRPRSQRGYWWGGGYVGGGSVGGADAGSGFDGGGGGDGGGGC